MTELQILIWNRIRPTRIFLIRFLKKFDLFKKRLDFPAKLGSQDSYVLFLFIILKTKFEN